MSEGESNLHVRLSRRVHEGLAIDVDFRLGNECGVLFGPSGSGKSTILKMIAGLIRPQVGRVRLGDTILFDSVGRMDRPLRNRGIGLIFQDDLLFPHLSVARNVRFGLGRHTGGDARVAEVAALCGIGHLMDRDPSTLSGGERQRVGLARALAPRPRLLLCDEPVSALDLEARHALVRRIARVQRLESIPVLYVTHAPDEAIALGSRLFLLEAGRIVAGGAPIDVLSTHGPRESFRLRNAFEANVIGHGSDGLSTTLRILDGPALVVPRVDESLGSVVTVSVGADDIVLAKGETGLISARNLIDGSVERVVPHGSEVEVIVRTGGVTWTVAVIPEAVEALGLIGGVEVRMIIKARSFWTAREP